MKQMLLPLVPEGTTQICNLVCVHRDDNLWTYFHGPAPVYHHDAGDKDMFQLITSMLIDCGTCRQVDILKTFGVSKSSVDRSLKKLRKSSVRGFLEKKSRGRRKGKGTVLTAERLSQAQALLDQGFARGDIAERLGVQADTLRKAINDGRLRKPANPPQPLLSGTSKSLRGALDSAASDGMGLACLRVGERALTAFGQINGATSRFEPCLDVPNGGSLCALPALLSNGILEGAEQCLGRIRGFYTMIQILLFLALMALCRIKNVEGLRKQAPGEWGKLLGLDRVPEARCLREKMDALSGDGGAEVWAAQLARSWMEPGTMGFYVDAHVRPYHGRLTNLPRRYVSRQRLCLRAITDYWVNDAVGRPFFVIEKTIDIGLIKTLESEIVPRLLADLPGQVSEEELAGNLLLFRFLMIFDREGYSPSFFKKMWRDHRVSCLTYRKYPGDSWPEEWFQERQVTMPAGERVNMFLAEMGTLIGSGKSAIWVREVRKLTDSGHQTSLVSTAYALDHDRLAAWMFSRWCQENFFKYMKEHFGIDMLSEYGTIEISDADRVVNPAWRELNRARNQANGKLRVRRAAFASRTMHPEDDGDAAKYEKWERKKGELLEEIEQIEHELARVKVAIKKTPRHIKWEELPDQDKFNRLLPGRKRLMDTIRMVAYRSETAMASLMLSDLVDMPRARSLLQGLFKKEADILPDEKNEILRVRIHPASTQSDNRALASLFTVLNGAEAKYPGTNLRLVYELVGKGG